MDRQRKQVAAWLLTGCFLIFLMVLIGGITRLTRSGLSIVEWNITGSLPPMSRDDWVTLFDKYKTSPEYRELNAYFTLSDFKKIFWWEYIHRLTGRLIGIVFIVPFFWFLIRKKFPAGYLRKSLILFAAGLAQGLLGWAMVKSGLNDVPHVSHFMLAAHLLAAFITFGITCWFALGLVYKNSEHFQLPALRRPAIGLLILVALQIVYGAFVAGLKAGYLYPVFPKMGDHWIPPEMKNAASFSDAVLSVGAGVQWVHRLLALLVLLFFLFLVVKTIRLRAPRPVGRIVLLAALMIMLQIITGISTLLLHVPVWLASVHQAGSFFIVFLLLLLIARTRGQARLETA